MTEEPKADDSTQAAIERFRNFIEARRSLESSSHKVAEQFDKAVMTLAAGGLSMSLLFVQRIGPQQDPKTVWLLAGGWIGFTASLLLVLCSFLFGYHSYRLEIKVLEEMYNDPHLKIPPPNKWVTCTLVSNWASAIALIFGATFIVMFAIMNTPNSEGGESMSKSQQPKSGWIALSNSAAATASSQVMFGPAIPLKGQTPTATNGTATIQAAQTTQTTTPPAQTGKKH